MGNLALNKTATASNSVAPYAPARAVDGSIQSLSRWLASGLPGWMTVDLGSVYWLNRWVVKQPGGSGWQSPNYNMVDFRFQGSLDNSNWIEIDAVSNNSASTVDRLIPGSKQARYARVYVTKGLRINNNVSAIMEFEVYEPDNAPYLANLVPSVSSLSPGFNQRVFAYTVNVDSGVPSIQFTPTALQTNMVIKVNNNVVTSGQASSPILLGDGNNPVTITVSSVDGSMTATYNINVIRGVVLPVAKLATLVMPASSGSITLNFLPDTFNYAAPVANTITWVKVTPTAGPGTTSITVNGVAVASGRTSAQINLNVGSNTITVIASGSGYTQGVYTIVVTRAA